MIKLFNENNKLTLNEDDTHFGYIYKMTMIPTGKIYIGKRESSTVDNKYYGSGRDWKIDLAKFGTENVKVEILDWADSRQELRDKEIYWISKLQAQDKSIGYNIHKGGAGGNSLGDTAAWSELHKGERNGRYNKPVSQETRDKISAANSGKIRSQEFKDKVSQTLKGRPKPDDFGSKISAAITGRPNTWTTGLTVQCVETGEIFNSLAKAADKYSTSGSSINRACKEPHRIAGGMHWRYFYED